MSPNVLSLHEEGIDINIQDIGVSREIPEVKLSQYREHRSR
jgi:hypothetical protein